MAGGPQDGRDGTERTEVLATGVRTVEGTTAGPAGILEQIRRPYKAGQGRVTRRIALAAGVAFCLWGAFDLWAWLQGFAALKDPLLPGTALSHVPVTGVALGGSVLLAALAAAAACVLVAWYLQRPWLADLLIETEAELKKVSWPAKEEAWNATKVVAATVVVFTVVLMVFDSVVSWLMRLLTGLDL